MTPGAKVMETRAVQYALQVEINADCARVWRGLTDQLSSWWLPDFHVLGVDSIVLLEPKAGGQLIEETSEKSLLWYTVLAITHEKSITLSGSLTPEWGGPATTFITWELEPRGETTVVNVTDALFGVVSDSLISSLESGWQLLFTDGLKKHVENS